MKVNPKNNEKIVSWVTILTDGRIVNKPIGVEFTIGDYLIYSKKNDFYYNILYEKEPWIIKNITAYVANNEFNYYPNEENTKIMIIDMAEPEDVTKINITVNDLDELGEEKEPEELEEVEEEFWKEFRDLKIN